ncbi:unnamed protein product, partial [Amoebophrya sp. A120]
DEAPPHTSTVEVLLLPAKHRKYNIKDLKSAVPRFPGAAAPGRRRRPEAGGVGSLMKMHSSPKASDKNHPAFPATVPGCRG